MDFNSDAESAYQEIDLSTDSSDASAPQNETKTGWWNHKGLVGATQAAAVLSTVPITIFAGNTLFDLITNKTNITLKDVETKGVGALLGYLAFGITGDFAILYFVVTNAGNIYKTLKETWDQIDKGPGDNAFKKLALQAAFVTACLSCIGFSGVLNGYTTYSSWQQIFETFFVKNLKDHAALNKLIVAFSTLTGALPPGLSNTNAIINYVKTYFKGDLDRIAAYGPWIKSKLLNSVPYDDIQRTKQQTISDFLLVAQKLSDKAIATIHETLAKKGNQEARIDYLNTLLNEDYAAALKQCKSGWADARDFLIGPMIAAVGNLNTLYQYHSMGKSQQATFRAVDWVSYLQNSLLWAYLVRSNLFEPVSRYLQNHTDGENRLPSMALGLIPAAIMAVCNYSITFLISSNVPKDSFHYDMLWPIVAATIVGNTLFSSGAIADYFRKGSDYTPTFDYLSKGATPDNEKSWGAWLGNKASCGLWDKGWDAVKTSDDSSAKQTYNKLWNFFRVERHDELQKLKAELNTIKAGT